MLKCVMIPGTFGDAYSLQIAENNSTAAFINCLKRHSYRFGPPALMISDNASNFRNFSSVLADLANSNDVKEIMISFNMERNS